MLRAGVIRMENDEEARRRAVRETALQTMGLVLLLERAGGSLTFTEREYEEAVARHGGPTQVTIHMEISKRGDGETSVELSLVRKPPANAELVS